MGGRILLFVTALLTAACSSGATQPEQPQQATIESAVVATTVDTTPGVVEDPPPVNIWPGFEATQTDDTQLVAITSVELTAYAWPNTLEPIRSIPAETILGTPTVLAVVDGPADGWIHVMLPGRPNGATGWISAESVDLFASNGKIIVDLSERTLTYSVGDVEVITAAAGIGSLYNPTPTGSFFVTDNVTLADPNSAWGPHAFGISARSDVITEFNGGDGIIGIHGTNNPSSVGGNISLGCVRLANDIITDLHHRVPIGTLVEIRA